MNYFDLLGALGKAGFSPERLRDATKFDKFLNELVAAFAAKDKEITELKARLKVRERRKRSATKAQSGRGPGRPAKYARSLDEHNYWFWHELNKGQPVPEFLAAVSRNRSGQPLTNLERNHIRKILSELLPSHVKRCRAAMRNGKCLRTQPNGELNCPHFFDCQGIGPQS
jgi:hypothetical protein